MFELGKSNGLGMNPRKSEIKLFTRKYKAKDINGPSPGGIDCGYQKPET